MGVILKYLILITLFYFVLKRLKSLLAYSSASQQNYGQKQQGSKKQKMKQDPYEILGVHSAADQRQIKQAYHELMAQYHPDKVAHLGPELQALAKEKSQEISWAYKQVSK